MMKRVVAISIAVILCLLTFSFVHVDVKGQRPHEKFLRAEEAVPNQYIVVLDESVAALHPKM